MIKAEILVRRTAPITETTWKRPAKREGKLEKNSPASKDRSISRKRFVSFSAMTLRRRRATDTQFSLSLTLFFSLLFFFCCSLTVSLCFSRLSASPLSCSLTFPLSCPLAHFLCQYVWAQRHAALAANSGGPSCLWKRKTTLSHFLPCCLKLATGVAYLSRTEILEVGRRGVAVITSSPIISVWLMNVKSPEC